MLHGSAATGGLFTDYEAYKRDHLHTDRQCSDLGFRFVPLVIEAHGGGWSALLRHSVDRVAKSQHTGFAVGQEPASLRIAQRISISLQRENARAILRRLVPAQPAANEAGWNDAVEADAE